VQSRDANGTDGAAARARMVERQVAGRGVRDEAVLQAMREVPRERFVPPDLSAHAFDDAPLPIGDAQTISQPYIVAVMAEAAELKPGERVLEVGTGSGYAAAVFSRLAEQVFTVERHGRLADVARSRFEALGYGNIQVDVRDGTLGWEAHAPYDAIIVAAGGPGRIPPALLRQLAPGGRLVIPRGETQEGQELVRLRRDRDAGAGDDCYVEESLGAVRFVPLVGAAGWTPDGHVARPSLPQLVADAAEPFDGIEDAALDALLQRIGDARLVLIGEASHGTSEFYRMRARITQSLIERKGFSFVAVEADWPDAAEIDAYVRRDAGVRTGRKPFTRFPRWMWANTDVMDFVHWMRRWNDAAADSPDTRVGFHGLDLYSMGASIESVLRYLEDVDPDAAAVARERYGCLAPWQNDPVLYGRAVLSGAFDKCEEDVVAMLDDLLRKRLEYARRDGSRFADAVQNARLVANAEKYYRAMYRGAVASWNLRDRHMFDTLRMLLRLYGDGARGVVWAHNSHLGDASATDMARRGEHNVGQLVRQAFGDVAHLIGFGTHTGTVAAAHDWDAPMQVMQVRPSHPRSYEHACQESGVPRFILDLRRPADDPLIDTLLEQRLERAIGVIYRPETELQSHYFNAILPRQFDEWIWFSESSAVTPIGEAHRSQLEGMPETFPFGL
jgi:protein-L-isoaspartate(D-aspartate) O-methyltransferase